MVRPLNTGWWDVHSVRMWGSAHTDSLGTIYPGEGELYMGLWSGGKPAGGNRIKEYVQNIISNVRISCSYLFYLDVKM